MCNLLIVIMKQEKYYIYDGKFVGNILIVGTAD